jgi:hypothetical protein
MVTSPAGMARLAGMAVAAAGSTPRKRPRLNLDVQGLVGGLDSLTKHYHRQN